jgi:hypothetical protein
MKTNNEAPIMEASAVSSHFLTGRPKHLPRQTLLYYPHRIFFSYYEKVLQTRTNNMQNYNSEYFILYHFRQKIEIRRPLDRIAAGIPRI